MQRFLITGSLVFLAGILCESRCGAQADYAFPGGSTDSWYSSPAWRQAPAKGYTYSYAGSSIDDPLVISVPEHRTENPDVYLFSPTVGYGYAGCGGCYRYGRYGSPLYRNSPLAYVLGGRGNACPWRLPCCHYTCMQNGWEYAYGAGGIQRPTAKKTYDPLAAQQQQKPASAPSQPGRKAPPAMGERLPQPKRLPMQPPAGQSAPTPQPPQDALP